ncbi:MAG: hypothetical protein DCC43_14720 [Candidatus Brocadia sp.]|uniref:Type II secretion system protein H n=1 Tax=Candidatus Brocadia fulgida TaxID=380242 RepID=A0A0M2UZR3_9BACT|nr:MAG: hypothetical protein BROFUL_01253 [Candidatus Brocadia fulgida]MCC6324568.1 GspH/FimT family pseudopilin [Candidatus Brocadia sp.]MCE7912321.1 prepilin-type N-terminal cleavage/methylation domain-containing protein [Candidatus Brocadia sp. AMX3]MDG5997910.1 prepilin-type N-terminal cleavage/methylation domain-containing protein [Candidatus Brocadia sp.]RIJ90639.1 MAG: hypothetical protein DCC43_14720 [Candidatus Brocadia sp.]
MNSQKGFSLLEMIIVLAIISVLAGTTISVYITMKPVLRLSGATRQIMGDLMWARMQAISQNNEFKIIYNNNHQYSILDDDNNNGIRDNDESLIKKNLHDKYDDVTYSSSNINNLIFFPRGNATNLTTITLTNISGIRTVSVAITGRVKR